MGEVMTTSFQMFLLAAQELNFSRAAERAYVTPQCLSDHIKRIEERYGVLLFIRKPKVQLTAEGETMQRYLIHIRMLEENMKNELADVSGGTRGTLRIGIPMTRGTILISKLITNYRQCFPNVEIELRLNDTKNLEELLLEGKLDLFLGVDAAPHALFQREVLGREPLYLVISSAAMKEQFAGQYEKRREEFLQNGADLRLLQGVSFVQGNSRSTTTLALEQLLLKQNLSYHFPIRVSSFDLHIDFCRMAHCATVCSRSHLRKVMQQPEGDLEVYTVRGSDKYLEVELITHRDAQSLAYRTAFLKLLKQRVLEEDAEICEWLRSRNIKIP